MPFNGRYHPFDISFAYDAATGYRVELSESPDGQAEASFVLPLTQADIDGWQNGTLTDQQLQALGTLLFEALFTGSVENRLRTSLVRIRKEDGLRINLRLHRTPELADIPWELLFDSESGRFLARSERTPIVRYLPLSLSAPETLEVQPPLRVLVVLASPTGIAPLDVEREWLALNRALAPLQTEGQLILERLETPSLDAIRRRLLGDPVHVFHFVGHGEFDEQSGEGGLMLADSEGSAQRVLARDLAGVLHNHRPLQLAYLNACEGALTAQGNVFGGVAQTLVQQELPAAVAMLREISDTDAATLAQAFYEAVAAGYPVDAALTQARTALPEGGRGEWATPVLFSRSEENRLFAVAKTATQPVAVNTPFPPSTTPTPARANSRLTAYAVAALALIVVLALIFILRPKSTPPTTDAPERATHTATSQPTATHTSAGVVVLPTETPTPAVVLVRGDVLIAELDQSRASREFNFAPRLEQDLKDRLKEYGLSSDVTVRVVKEVVTNEDEALSLAENAGAKAVVWGWADDLDVGIRVELIEGGGAETGLAATTQLPLMEADTGQAQLAFVVREGLPQNVSFLSLFVIGHLNYLSNHYELGHKAFDAAMEALPEEVVLENPALFAFFAARKLEGSDDPADVAAVACGYVAAIEADPAFAVAYNNLGTLISRRFGESSAIPEEIVACLQRIDTPTNSAHDAIQQLFATNVELQPNSALAVYNQASYQWTHGGWDVSEPDQIALAMEFVIQTDPAFIGAQIILGNYAFEQKEYQQAADHFLQAGVRLPSDGRLRFNSGQALAKLGRTEEATAAFQAALEIDPTLYEATLALAAQAYSARDWPAALALLDAIPAPDADGTEMTSPQVIAQFLHAAIAFATGDSAAAQSGLEQLASRAAEGFPVAPHESLLRYQLALLALEQDDRPAAEESLASVDVSVLNSIWSHNYFKIYHGSIAAAWFDLILNCGEDFAVLDETTDDCLPAARPARVAALFDGVVNQFSERLYYGRGDNFGDLVNMGAACPFVYLYDDAGNLFFETTILYGIVGPAQEQRQSRPLSRFDGRVLVREVEDETSYIDRLYVEVVYADGERARLEPAHTEQTASLFASDDRYTILQTGDEIKLTFPSFQPGRAVAEARIVAEGYYVPLTR